MSDIPEEIMEEARQVCPDVYPTSVARDATIKAIAQAIISAEARGMERAAKICDWLYPVYVTGKGFRMEPAETDIEHVGNAYADAIRNGTEASDA